MNEEKDVVIMTLWNNIPDSEVAIIDNDKESLRIIRASGLTVSKYYDGSLGSTPSTVIVKNPGIS
ncbi:hypothetical protein ACJIZ3_023376 [Penstemon smallii]|uniref:Uncharacterized protein n=1 Tax=Penstemon smallii TaxID=265156 RepID=A0ABD3TPY6_9LAMI